MGKLGSGGLGSLTEMPQHPGSSACLLYRVEQRGRVLLTVGPYIQINMEAGLLHTAEQGGGVSGTDEEVGASQWRSSDSQQPGGGKL